MRVAIVANGVVKNVILAPAAGSFGGIEAPDWVAPGDLYEGGQFTRPTRRLDHDEKKRGVNVARAARVTAGTVVEVTGVGPIPLQGRPEDARNLQALAFAASLRIGQGDTTTETVFRDADNVDHILTPPQVLELWRGGADYVSALYAASWALKAMEPIPDDFADDQWWPEP